MRKIAIIFTILIFITIGISMARDVIIKKSIESAVSITTGLRMDIGKLRVSIPRTFINIRDVVILNPAYFNDEVMLVMPEIYIDFDFSGILKKEIHLYDLAIDLKEFTIVKAEDGKLNIDYLKNLKEKSKEDTKQKKNSVPPKLQIDQLALKIGKVVYKDYSGGGDALVSEYNVNINAKYKDLKGSNEIVRVIIARAVMNTAIDRLSDFKKLKDTTLDTIGSGRDILKKTRDELKGILKAPF